MSETTSTPAAQNVAELGEVEGAEVGGELGGKDRDILGQRHRDFCQGGKFGGELARLCVVDGVGRGADQRRRRKHVANLEHQLDGGVFGLDVVCGFVGGELVAVEQTGGGKVGERVDAEVGADAVGDGAELLVDAEGLVGAGGFVEIGAASRGAFDLSNDRAGIVGSNLDDGGACACNRG